MNKTTLTKSSQVMKYSEGEIVKVSAVFNESSDLTKFLGFVGYCAATKEWLCFDSDGNVGPYCAKLRRDAVLMLQGLSTLIRS